MKEPKRSSALVRRETFASYCFLLPSLIFFLGFVIYPMILCVVTSFFDSTMNRADIFVGMANYKTLFADPIFLGALKNTFVIVIVSVPITCIFSLWVSSAIVDLPEWATSLFRCVFYLPVVTGSAEVDGATDFQCFWKIKWPAIMPTTLYILVITTINSFQCFALIQLLTSGGPNHKTDTIMYYIYYTAFKQYKYGYGNAMGVVLAVIIAILSAVQFKLGNKDN